VDLKEVHAVKVFNEISPHSMRRMLNKQLTLKDIIADKPPKLPSSLTDFELLDIIAVGPYSRTHLCRYIQNSNYYALKILHRSVIYENKQTLQLFNEKYILRSVSHPGIIKLFTTFNTTDALYLLMEFIPGGELFMYIRTRQRFDSQCSKFYAAQIIIILEYLHQQKIAVRDLKPENILMDCNGNVKLSEFGFSKLIEDRTWTICCSPDYLAPEILSGSGYTTSVDIWSLGILIFEMLAGYPPFASSNAMEILQLQYPSNYISFPDYFEPECIDLLQRLLVSDPIQRLGASNGFKDLKNHIWFKNHPQIDWNEISTWNGNGPILPSLNSPLENYKHLPDLDNSLPKFQQNFAIPSSVSTVFDDF